MINTQFRIWLSKGESDGCLRERGRVKQTVTFTSIGKTLFLKLGGGFKVFVIT